MSELASKTGELATLFVEEEARTVLLHQEQGDRSLELGMYRG